MKKSPYTRVAKSIEGAQKAKATRSHAINAASPATKKLNPQRMDIIRRGMLSGRNKDNLS